MKKYTRELASWITKNKFQDIPEDVVEKMKELILDAIGCALHGSRLPLVKKTIDAFANEECSKKNCVIWGTNRRARADLATLINGTAIQSDELDEAGQETHASASNLSSLLALSEQIGGVDGKFFLNSLIIGQEVLFRVANCFTAKNFLYQNLKYHQAGVLSPIGTMATLAQIYGLSTDELCHGFGLAGNRGFSLEISRISSEDKRMMQARGGMNGVHSAMLAKQGFTGIENIFETEGGYFQFFTQSQDLYDLDALLFKLGEVWYTRKSELKRYMGMIFQHEYYFCAKMLKENHSFNIQDIDKIELMISPLAYKHSNHVYNKQDNKIFAQFCIPYGIAVMLIEGNVFIDEFTPEKLSRPDILELIKKIELIPNPAWPEIPTQNRPSHIKAYLKNGIKLEQEIVYGAENYPLSREEVIKKFKLLSSPVFNKKRQNEIINMVLNIEEINDVSLLAQLLHNDSKF